MSDEARKAARYLEGKPFTVKYVEMDENGKVVEDVHVLIEEYPDFIPNKEDVIILNKVYVVIHRAYTNDRNELYIVVQNKEMYDKNLKKRY